LRHAAAAAAAAAAASLQKTISQLAKGIDSIFSTTISGQHARALYF
jgi:flagellin-like hook-associated protein FlgL